MRKNMMKWVAALLMLLSAGNVVAYDFKVDGICYTYDQEKMEATVVSPGGTSYYVGDIVVPATVTYGRFTFTVTCIDYHAFGGDGNVFENVTSVTLPNTITTIGKEAFMKTGITEMVIPNSVKAIGDGAFRYTSSLKKITLPDNPDPDQIGSSAFSNMGVEELVIPDSWTDIYCDFTACEMKTLVVGKGIKVLKNFSHCEQLQNIVFPEDGQLQEIGDKAFQYCTSLSSVNLPTTVSVIGKDAFSNCGFTIARIPAHVTTLQSGAYSYNSLDEIVIEDADNVLTLNSFDNCKPSRIYVGRNLGGSGFRCYPDKLKTFFFGSKVTSALFGLSSVTSFTKIIALMPNPAEVPCEFSNTTYSKATLYVPKGMVDAYSEAPGWKNFFFIEEKGDEHKLSGSLGVLNLREDGVTVSGPRLTADISLKNEGTITYDQPILVRVTENSYSKPTMEDNTWTPNLKPGEETGICIPFDANYSSIYTYTIDVYYKSNSEDILLASKTYKVREAKYTVEGNFEFPNAVAVNSKLYHQTGSIKYNVNIKNKSEFAYNDKIRVCLYNAKEPDVIVSNTYFNNQQIDVNGELTIDGSFYCRNAGETYFCTLIMKSEGEETVLMKSAEFTTTNEEKYNLAGTITIDEQSVAPVLSFNYAVENKGSNNYAKKNLLFKLYSKHDGEWYFVKDQSITTEVSVSAGATITGTLSFEDVDKGSTYKVDAYYYSCGEAVALGSSQEFTITSAVEVTKCADPTISIKGGKLHFDCETEGVTFHYSITVPQYEDNTGNDVDMSATYTVKVYATKDGFQNSETVTQKIDVRGLKGDVNDDGEVDIADAVKIVNLVVGKIDALARPAKEVKDEKEPQ